MQESRLTVGECRLLPPQSRSRASATSRGTASGYGAVFYDGTAETQYSLQGDIVYERIDPHAFDAALSRPDDVRGLFNHNADHLLGRTAAGTLRLTVDKIGLRYQIDLGGSTIARDVADHLERGDLSGSSFSFIVDRADWITDGDRDIRLIRSVRLFDVGPVTYPAYGASTAGLRSTDRQHD